MIELANNGLSINSPIPTLSGWKTLENILVGDILFDEKGAKTNVTYTSSIIQSHITYDVIFSDGSTITAGANQQWSTWTRNARRIARTHAKEPNKKWSSRPQCQPRIHCDASTVTTEEILSTLIDERGGKFINHSIEVCKPFQCLPIDCLIHPYVLGVWLGDGTSKAPIITTCDPEILEEIKKAGYGVKSYKVASDKTPIYGIGCKTYKRAPYERASSGLPNDSLRSKLKTLDLFDNKHIPDEYLRASIEQRLAVLQGLMDTDGHVDMGGNCELTLCNERLAVNAHELCISLGFKATIHASKAYIYGKDCGNRYRITFTPYIPVFRLPRKLERLHTGKNQKERQFRRYIIDIRPGQPTSLRGIKVDSSNHLFLIGRTCIPTHGL